MINVAGETPAASDGGYQLVVNRRRGAQRPKTAKEAADRAPAGRLRVQKGGRAAREGSRYRVVWERGGGGFSDCAVCGEPACGGRLCGDGGGSPGTRRR